MALYTMLREQRYAEFQRERSQSRQGGRQPGPTEISTVAKQSRRKTLTSSIYAEVSLPFHHQNT